MIVSIIAVERWDKTGQDGKPFQGSKIHCMPTEEINEANRKGLIPFAFLCPLSVFNEYAGPGQYELLNCTTTSRGVLRPGSIAKVNSAK